MNLSLGELESLALKALRGARYPWGLAEEGAWALRWLAIHRCDATSNLLRLLQVGEAGSPARLFPDQAWASTAGSVCPIAAGAAISDRVNGERPVERNLIDIDALLEPVLVLPFLAIAWGPAAVVDVSWPGATMTVSSKGIADRWPPPIANVKIEPRPETQLAPETPPEAQLAPGAQPASRIDIDGAVLEALDSFARRTYAPGSIGSRDGAGAGRDANT